MIKKNMCRLVLVVTLGLLHAQAFALDGTWNVDAAGNWSDTSKWTGGNVADGTGATATLGDVITASRTITLNSNRTNGNIIALDTDNDYTIDGTSTLTLDVTSGSPVITNLSGRTLTISCPIAGSDGLTKQGAGTLSLSGANTFTTTATISAGTLRLQGAPPLNTGRTYTINGGAVMNLNGGATFNTSVAGSSTINGTGILRLSGGSYGRDNGGGGTLTAALGVGGLIDIQSGASVNTYWGSVVIFTGNLATLNVDGTFGGNTGLTISSAALTGAGTIDNSGTTLAIGNGSGTFSGKIRNSASLTKNGTGTQTLSGTNDYSGLTTISLGVLRITTGSALGTTVGGTTQSGSSALEIDGSGGAVVVGAEAITINGGGISNYGAIRNIEGSNTYGGTVTLAARSRINSDIGTLTLSNATAVTGGANGLVVGGYGNVTISGVFTTSLTGATPALLKDGNGTLTLSGNNTYAGTTTINAGTLALGHATDTLAGAVIVDGTNAILSIAGNSDTVGAVSLKNGAQITGSGGTLTGSSYAVESGSVSAILGGSAALTKSTVGTVTLSGANSYTGATAVNGGTLLLDMTGTGALASTSALTLGGGTFSIKGKTSSTTAQTLGALTVNAGGSQIVLDSNGGTSTTLTLANSAPTRAAGGTLAVDLSIVNTVLTSTLGLAADSQTTTQAVLGYATVKDATSTGFAANVGGNIVRYTGADELQASSNSGTTNYKITPVGTTTTGSPLLTTAASAAYNSLSIDTSGATGANFLSLNGTVSLTQKGLLMTGNNDFTIQGGTQLGAAATELIVHQAGTGTLTISSLISSTTGSLTKAGTGTLVLTGNNAYTGVTTINAGILKLQGGAFYTKARNYSISSGAVLNVHGGGGLTATGSSSTISGTGTLRVTGGTWAPIFNGSDKTTMSLGAGALIDIQSGAGIDNGGWTPFTWTSNQASMNVDGTFNLADGNAVTIDALTGTGSVSKGWGGATTFTVGTANGSGTFSGAISGGANVALTKTGTGTQTLSGNNSYTGITTVNGGTLQFAKTNSLYTGVTTDWVRTKIIVNSGATIAFNVGGAGEFTTGDVTTLLAGLGGAVNNNGLRSGSTIAFDTSNASGGTFTIANNIADTTSTGGGAVSLKKLGTGTLVLSGTNTYSGSTTVSAGTLSLTGGSALADAYSLYTTSSAKINLTGNETINKLFLDGREVKAGTWGSTSSTATYKWNDYFTGSGVLTVTSGAGFTSPPPPPDGTLIEFF